jgi:hypothetical protein
VVDVGAEEEILCCQVSEALIGTWKCGELLKFMSNSSLGAYQ